MLIEIKELIFTDQNIEHIARHNVVPEEIRSVLLDKPVFFEAKYGRIMMIGPASNKRFLTVILSEVKQKVYYVVTGRDADRKERNMYKQESERRSS